jgi:alpha-ribazole phosphatase
MKIYTINLIRHGIVEENMNKRFIGSTDKPLCDVGKKELKEYKEKYQYPKSDIIFSSPLKRCVETAQILFDKDPLIIPDLKECNFGDFEGKTNEELETMPEFTEWRKGAFDYRPPNGESWKDVAERTKVAFIKIVESMLKTDTFEVTIVTHAGIIMTIMSMFGFPQKEPMDWFVKNGCGFTLKTDMKSWMRSQLFEVVNDLPENFENVFVIDKEKN